MHYYFIFTLLLLSCINISTEISNKTTTTIINISTEISNNTIIINSTTVVNNTEIVKGNSEESDILIKIIEIVAGILVAVLGLFTACHFTCRSRDFKPPFHDQMGDPLVTSRIDSISYNKSDESDDGDDDKKERGKGRSEEPPANEKEAEVNEEKSKTDVTNNAAPKPARFEKRILTQQERGNFCIENPKIPHHLVIAIANFTCMMLPQWQPVLRGHCCILPKQHDLATRSVDDNVWDEIHNFKKYLLMMFAKQEKEVVFLETVIGLAKQSRHCMIECIPLPPEVAKQAPLYFKKAIDEAEKDNAKKLFDTSEKGLRHSIPPDLPYFLVEFGLEKGYVLVINDESQFKSSFGSNVVRKMCHLPEEDMHLPDRRDSLDTQKQAVAEFRRDWDSFDWTKQRDTRQNVQVQKGHVSACHRI